MRKCSLTYILRMLIDDFSGRLFIAHSQPRLSWACMLRLHATDAWAHHRYDIYGALVPILHLTLMTISVRIGSFLAMLGFIWYWYHQRAAAKDVERITQMLQIVLVKLRENVHNGEAQPRYLILARLHDELLQHETAVMERLHIWGMVE